MSWTTNKVNSIDKNKKVDRINPEKIVIDKVRGSQLLYISYKFVYKVGSWLLQCFFLNFSILIPWRVSSIILFPLNDLGLPLVDHLNLYLSVYPIGHPLRPLCALGSQYSMFKGFLYINVVRKLAVKPLMRW